MALDHVINLINDARYAAGIPIVRPHSMLMASAKAHSRDMAKFDFLSHMGSDGSTAQGRMEEAGYHWTYAGESCAEGQQNGDELVAALMNSPAHKQILLGKQYKHIGVGMNSNFWTVDVAAGMPDDAEPLPWSDYAVG